MDVGRLVERLRSGDEDAFFALIEAPPSVIPVLVAHHHREADSSLRARIVEIVWQHRVPESVAFLADALADASDRVWKQALDGLVTIGGPGAAAVLRDASASLAPEDDRSPWIAEALEQLGG